MVGIVAIVGRPNVGKSTLFNRMSGQRKSIVADQPGVTRDRIYAWSDFSDSVDEQFMLIDTGGFEEGASTNKQRAWDQTLAAIEAADVVILLTDGREGPHAHDHHLWLELRRAKKQVIVAVNKLESPEQTFAELAFCELGVDRPIALSASHGMGVGELRDRIEPLLPRTKKQPEDASTSIAIIGRPNAGKSSILNRLLGEERSLVSEVAGTTVDSVDGEVQYFGRRYRFIDTAGLRRKTKIKEKLEGLAVMRSLAAIEDAQIVVLVIDATEGLTDQDAKLANLALDRYKGLIIVVNKWDLMPDKDQSTFKNYQRDLHDSHATLKFAPLLSISCTENQRVHRLKELIHAMTEEMQHRVPTAKINQALERIKNGHTPAFIKSHTKRLKFYFATQVSVAPPTIVIKCNLADQIQESYQRYISHQLRAELGFKHGPLKVIYRGKDA